MLGREHDRAFDWRALVVGITVVGIAVRAYGLGTESLWFDEIVSATVVTNRGFEYILFQLPSSDPHPPLYYAVLKFWTGIVGTSEVGLRSLSVLADAVSIVLTYAVASRLFDRRVGIASALLFSLSPFYVWYGREARMYALATVLALASFYALLAIVQKDETRWRNGWSYVVATIALCYTHVFGVLVVLAQNAYVADGLLDRGYVGGLIATRWAKLQVMVGLAVLPYYIELLVQTFVGPLQNFVAWIPEPTLATAWKILGSYVGRAVPPASPEARYSLWTFGAPFGDLSVVGELLTLAALLLALYALFGVVRREDDVAEYVTPELLLFAWFVIPLLALYAISFGVTAVVFDRYTAMFGVAFLILVARGLTLAFAADGGLSLPIGPDRRTVLAAGVVVLVLAVPLAGLHAGTQKQPWREATALVESNAASDDAVLVSPRWSRRAYEYYATRDLQVVGIPAGASEDAIARETEGARVVWLVAAFTTGTDYGRFVSTMQDLGYSVDRRETFTDVTVYRFVRGG